MAGFGGASENKPREVLDLCAGVSVRSSSFYCLALRRSLRVRRIRRLRNCRLVRRLRLPGQRLLLRRNRRGHFEKRGG